MEVVVFPSGEAIAVLVADAVEELVRARPSAVLGLATGSSPLPVYDELARRHRAGTSPSYQQVTAFLLDEYVGLPPGHAQAYRSVIEREVVARLDLPVERLHAPDADSARLPDAGARYEALIAEPGGVDLQLLGIGADGHLAFNEPGSSLASRTRLKTLTARTRADNARYFSHPDEVPRHVLTQGLGTILDARHLVLVAVGSPKASAVALAVEGPLSASCPASVLQLHPHVTVLLDADAASALERAEHYREVHAGKPDWQGY